MKGDAGTSAFVPLYPGNGKRTEKGREGERRREREGGVGREKAVSAAAQ